MPLSVVGTETLAYLQKREDNLAGIHARFEYTDRQAGMEGLPYRDNRAATKRAIEAVYNLTDQMLFMACKSQTSSVHNER
jgi:hypothetical protein